MIITMRNVLKKVLYNQKKFTLRFLNRSRRPWSFSRWRTRLLARACLSFIITNTPKSHEIRLNRDSKFEKKFLEMPDSLGEGLQNKKDRGTSSYLLGVKKAALVPFRMLNLKRSTDEAFVVPLKVWSQN